MKKIMDSLTIENTVIGLIVIVASSLCASLIVYIQSSPEEIAEAASKAFEKGDYRAWTAADWWAVDKDREARTAAKKRERDAAAAQLLLDRKKTGKELFEEDSDKLVGRVKISSNPFPSDLIQENPWLITTIESQAGFVRVSYVEGGNLQKGNEVDLHQKVDGSYYITAPMEKIAQN